MAGVKSVGQDAAFDTNQCWVWWPGKSPDFGYAADCIDGKTGLKVKYENCDSESTPSTFSECSTFVLLKASSEIIRISCGPEAFDGKPVRSLSAIRQLKHHVSPRYESAKAEFLRHRVFNEWSCRH